MLTVRMVGDRRAGQCEKHFSLLPSPNTLYYLLRDHMCVLLFSSVVVNSGVPTILENTDFRGSEDLILLSSRITVRSCNKNKCMVGGS